MVIAWTAHSTSVRAWLLFFVVAWVVAEKLTLLQALVGEQENDLLRTRLNVTMA